MNQKTWALVQGFWFILETLLGVSATQLLWAKVNASIKWDQ